MPEPAGTLHYGDCLDVLRGMPAGIADLVYLDPPFNSDKAYNAFFGGDSGADAQITAFKDTWQWGRRRRGSRGRFFGIRTSDGSAISSSRSATPSAPAPWLPTLS